MRWPLLGDIPDLYRDVTATFARLATKYGPRAPFYMGMQRGMLLSDPEDARRVLLAPESDARKSRYTKMMGVVFGDSVLIAEGEAWQRQRDYLNPLFTPKAVRTYIPIILDETRQLLGDERLAQGAEFEAGLAMRRLIQKIMGRILFGDLFPRAQIEELTSDLQTVNDQLFGEFIRNSILRGLLARIATRGARELKDAVGSISRFIDELLALKIDDDDPSLAAAIIRAAPQGPSRAKEIKDQITVLFYAGQDTTARALAWTLYFLSSEPHWVRVIRDETGTARLDDPSHVDLKRLGMTLNVIRESMRLRPVAYAIDRQFMRDGVLDSEAAAGVIAPIAVSNVHRAAGHWDNPDEFQPTRFTQEASHGRHACAYIPFGHGRRKCVGASLGELEMTLIVASFCARFDFERVDRAPIRAKAAVTLAPHPEIRLKLTVAHSAEGAGASMDAAAAD
jgi:cytochrome P450